MHDHAAVTRVDTAKDLQHPPLRLPDREAVVGVLAGVGDDGGEVGPEVLEDEHGVFVLSPEVLVQYDDVWGSLQHLKGFDFSESRLVVVDLLEGDGKVVGEAAAAVDVGVSS